MRVTSKRRAYWIRKYLVLLIGAILAATGLETFLIPNQIIDGGVVGIAIMTSYLTHWPFGLLLILLNLPFLYLGYTQIGKTFAFSTIFSIFALSAAVTFMHGLQIFTTDMFLAAIFGGIVLGLGVGLIIRNGGSLDGTEIVAIILDKRTGFSVGEIILFFNIFILGSAGLVYSPDRAMYSLVAYFVTFKMIDLVNGGIDESKGVIVVSEKPDEIAQCLMARLGRGVTILYGEGAYTGESRKVLYSVITRLEVSKFKSIVDEIDENAFITLTEVHDVMGGKFKKKAIH